MKLKIVHDEMLKCALKDDRIIIGEWEDKILVSPDGYKSYIVPADKFFLDVEKVLRGRPKFQTDSFIKQERDAKQIFMTNDVKILKNGTVIKIGEKWVDMKNLKAFENPQFTTTGSRFSPIYIYENSELVGFIMPVNVREGESE